MKSFNLHIPDVEIDRDFIIIYKKSGSEHEEKMIEIKTSKDELIRKLHYFRQKMVEMKYMTSIYIQDKFESDLFKNFIDSVTTKQIQINDKNYFEYYELSKKYGYLEMNQKVEEFISERPDIQFIISQLSQSDENSEENALKEEIIAKNIDICLQNGFLSQMPLSTMVRILNSPKRILKDHHLLFNFVIERIEKCCKGKMNEREREIIEMLTSSLDYNFMNNEEIKELLENENMKNIFTVKSSNEKIKNLIKENEALNERIDKQDSIINELQMKQNEIFEFIQKQNKNFEEQQSIMKEQLSKQQMAISSYEAKSKQNEAKIKEMENKLSEQNEIKEQLSKQQMIISSYEAKSKQNEAEINEMKHKLAEQNDMIQKQQSSIQAFLQHNDSKKKEDIQDKIELSYKSGQEFNGIIQYLRKSSNIDNEIKISASSCLSNDYKPENVIKFGSRCVFESKHEQDPFLCIKFINHKVIPKNYSIRSASLWDKNNWHPRSWVIEGKNEGENWKIIDKQTDCPFLNGRNIIHTFNIENVVNKSYEYLRIRQTGPNWFVKDIGLQDMLVFDSIEFYGFLI